MAVKKPPRRFRNGLVVLLAAAGLLAATPAHAYLDPASGSYVIQILLAMAVSIVVAVRHYWARLASFWSRLTSGQGPKGRSSEDQPGDTE